MQRTLARIPAYYPTDWNRSVGNGAAVLPVADGTISGSVVPTCPTTGYGCYVQVDHAPGVCTLYGHLSGVMRTSGMVGHAEQIGTVGSTGNSTGPHLHLRFQQISNGTYYSRCFNNGSTCANGETPRGPQSPKLSPLNTTGGPRALADGQSYTSNNEDVRAGNANTVLWNFGPDSAGWSATGGWRWPM